MKKSYTLFPIYFFAVYLAACAPLAKKPEAVAQRTDSNPTESDHAKRLVHSAIGEKRRLFNECYKTQLEIDPKFKVKIVALFTFESASKTSCTEIKVESHTGANIDQFKVCLCDALSTARISDPSFRYPTKVTYPIVFVPTEK